MPPPEANRLSIGRAQDGHDIRRPSLFIAASGSRLRFSAPARRLPLELAGWGIRSLVIISGRTQAGDRAESRRNGGSRRSAALCGPVQRSRLVPGPRYGSIPAVGRTLPLWPLSAARGRPRERWRASIRSPRSAMFGYSRQSTDPPTWRERRTALGTSNRGQPPIPGAASSRRRIQPLGCSLGLLSRMGSMLVLRPDTAKDLGQRTRDITDIASGRSALTPLERALGHHCPRLRRNQRRPLLRSLLRSPEVPSRERAPGGLDRASGFPFPL
jgi:hypothetical protein